MGKFLILLFFAKPVIFKQRKKYILIHINWLRKFMFILKLVVDTKSAPRLEGKRKQKKKNAKLYRRL